MTSMNVPDPVMSLAVIPKTRESASNFTKALYRFQREDPTFRVCQALPAYSLDWSGKEDNGIMRRPRKEPASCSTCILRAKSQGHWCAGMRVELADLVWLPAWQLGVPA